MKTILFISMLYLRNDLQDSTYLVVRNLFQRDIPELNFFHYSVIYNQEIQYEKKRMIKKDKLPSYEFWCLYIIGPFCDFDMTLFSRYRQNKAYIQISSQFGDCV